MLALADRGENTVNKRTMPLPAINIMEGEYSGRTKLEVTLKVRQSIPNAVTQLRLEGRHGLPFAWQLLHHKSTSRLAG